MREIQYKDFSWKIHQKNWQTDKPNVCQFELTYKCGLHCRHCYSDCYNDSNCAKKELGARQVKIILDKIYDAGVVWLCFTGGDPLARKDFFEIYSYAKNKGFIISIFSNGYSMTEEIADFLKKSPPFVIEITLNSVSKEIFEKMSSVDGSFEKTLQGIDRIRKRSIALRLKTLITRQNYLEFGRIKGFVEKLGLNFEPDYFIFPRLNRDLSVLDLRLPPREIVRLSGFEGLSQTCFAPEGKNSQRQANLFDCAIGGKSEIKVNPYGEAFPCLFVREPSFSLFEVSADEALSRISESVRNKKFSADSKCKNCGLRPVCFSCPGKAKYETGAGKPVEYYCELANLMVAQSAKKEPSKSYEETILV